LWCWLLRPDGTGDETRKVSAKLGRLLVLVLLLVRNLGDWLLRLL